MGVPRPGPPWPLGAEEEQREQAQWEAQNRLQLMQARRMEREAKALAQLNGHPNIVEIRDRFEFGLPGELIDWCDLINPVAAVQ